MNCHSLLMLIIGSQVIRQNLCSLETFCDIYAQQKKELLELGRPPSDYNNSVYTTWEISAKQIQSLSATDTNAEYALELLQTFAFMHFDGISENIFERAKKNTLDYVDGSMFSATATNRRMLSGWDPLTIAKALKILLDFSLITINGSRQISMHPLVHEWSRERNSTSEREHAWETAVSTMAMSIYIGTSKEENKHRLELLPHIDACLNSPDGKRLMFNDGLRIQERYLIVDKFALVYEEADRDHNALELHSRNATFMNLILQIDDPYIVHAKRRSAYCLAKLGRFEAAAELQESVLETVRQKTGENELGTSTLYLVQELAGIYKRWGNFDKALVMLEEVVQGCTRTFGPLAERTWDAKVPLASCLWCLGRCREAAEMQEKILEHAPTLDVMEGLVLSYYDLGKKRMARKMQEQVVVETRQQYGEFHPRTLACKSLAMSTSRWMDPRTGVEARKKDLEIIEANLGELHHATLRAIENLADGYFIRGSLEKARQIQMRAVNISIQLYGSDHPITLSRKRDLAYTEKVITLRKIVYWWIPDRILAKFLFGEL